MRSSAALRSVRAVLAVAGAALVGVFGLATPAAAHASVAAEGIGTGSGRLGAVVAAVVGLIALGVGGWALARSAGRIGTGSGSRSAREGAIVAMVVGLMGMGLAGVHLATSTGGFGTGNGRAGAIVAMVVALTGVVLGRLALVRSRSRHRTAAPPHGLTG